MVRKVKQTTRKIKTMCGSHNKNERSTEIKAVRIDKVW